MSDEKKYVLFYDGVCGLCNSSVNLIIENERDAIINFSPLQSDYAKSILSQFPQTDNIDSLILFDIQENSIESKSKAVFTICKYLKWPFKAGYYFRFIPTFITDFFYDLVAASRYKIFGKYDSCKLPDAKIKDRFIGDPVFNS